jgi:HD superfamily phosphohydrolase
LAENRKALEQEQEQLTAQQSKLTEQLATLEAMINEETLTDEQLAEMREYEPERYIEHIEKQSKRKEFLKEAKKNAKPVSNVNVQEEQAKLIKANPDWIKDGKATDAYQKDMEALTSYYHDNGFTEEQITSVNQSAVLAQAVIDAARYKAINTQKAVVEKRVRKAPVSTKPKAQATNTQRNEMKSLIAKAKKGDERAFARLRKLQREQQGN